MSDIPAALSALEKAGAALSTARAALTTPPAATKKPIYFSGKGTQLSASVLAAYNAIRAKNVNPPDVGDTNHDGVWDGTANFSIINGVPLAGLDWEGARNVTYMPLASGVNMMRAFARADSIYTPAHQARVALEYSRAVKGWKASEPSCLIGMYGVPYYASNGGGVFANGLSGNILTQASNNVSVLWNAVDVIMPEAYIKFDETGTGAAGAPQCTEAQALQFQHNVAELSIRAAQSVSGYKPIYPYVSIEVYNSTPDHTALSNRWIYIWVKGLMITFNGRRIDGVMLWNRAAGEYVNEGHLKAVYQAVNDLPYDPNMPRPQHG